jgi:hypothetical protein
MIGYFKCTAFRYQELSIHAQYRVVGVAFYNLTYIPRRELLFVVIEYFDVIYEISTLASHETR